MKTIYTFGIGTVLLGSLLLLGTMHSSAADERPADIIAPCTASTATAEKKHIVVRLGHYTDDLHAASMAVGMAKTLQERGQKVTLMLTLEGVRLADIRTPQDLRWGHGDDIAKAYSAFIEAGGEVIVCPHCANAAGFDEKSLRPGARMARQGNDLADVIIAADKVLDF